MNPQVNLSEYKSFGFFEKLDTDERYESLLSQYLKASTKAEMQSRGFTFTENNPDLLINFNQETTDKQYVRQIPTTTGGYYGYRGHVYYDTWVGFEPYIENYQQGTLTIDIVERQQNKMVWQGVAVDVINPDNLKHLDTTVPTLVNAIFKQFPIAAPAPVVPAVE